MLDTRTFPLSISELFRVIGLGFTSINVAFFLHLYYNLARDSKGIIKHHEHGPSIHQCGEFGNFFKSTQFNICITFRMVMHIASMSRDAFEFYYHLEIKY
jgi:hypothetical protein